MFKKKFNNPGVPNQAQQTIDQVKHRTADYLNERSSRLSSRQIKVMLLLFCLTIGGTSLYRIVRGIMPANGPPVIKRANMPIPKLIPDSVFINSKTNKNDNTTK
jgi:hypothetical protein